MVVPSGDIEFVLHRCVQTIIAMTGYGLLHRLGKRHWQKHDCECAVSYFFLFDITIIQIVLLLCGEANCHKISLRAVLLLPSSPAICKPQYVYEH